jgi:3-oxoacyl-[acyl-carrier-protein] synthase II
MAPEKCQPFDKNRKGMMLGEGAAILVLESLENAKKRKAPIYAEILGYGLSCDANHMTHPDYKGIVKAIKKSMKMSGVNVASIDYVSAHGTGTNENDKAECQAYTEIFGDRVCKIPISSIKSMLGHSMGAASAFESIACCLAIKKSSIPPTINYESKDSECAIDCVANIGRTHKCSVVLNNSQAFGGNNACIILGSLN